MDGLRILAGLGDSHESKPNNVKIIKSKKKAVTNYRYYDIGELAGMVGDRGYSIVPSYLHNNEKKAQDVYSMSQEDFVSCQIFMIDFDGQKWDEKKECYTGTDVKFDEIKERADDYGLPIAFAYKTLSCPDTVTFYKYRIAFIHDQTICDKQIATLIYKALGRIFPECDQACCEVSRMFLGGKELIYFDENARINLMQITHSLYRVLASQKNLKRDLKVFMKKNKIDIEVRNGMIMAGTMDVISAFDENYNSPNLIILKAESGFSSIFYFKSSEHENRGFWHQDKTCTNKHK